MKKHFWSWGGPNLIFSGSTLLLLFFIFLKEMFEETTYEVTNGPKIMLPIFLAVMISMIELFIRHEETERTITPIEKMQRIISFKTLSFYIGVINLILFLVANVLIFNCDNIDYVYKYNYDSLSIYKECLGSSWLSISLLWSFVFASASRLVYETKFLFLLIKNN